MNASRNQRASSSSILLYAVMRQQLSCQFVTEFAARWALARDTSEQGAPDDQAEQRRPTVPPGEHRWIQQIKRQATRPVATRPVNHGTLPRLVHFALRSWPANVQVQAKLRAGAASCMRQGHPWMRLTRGSDEDSPYFCVVARAMRATGDGCLLGCDARIPQRRTWGCGFVRRSFCSLPPGSGCAPSGWFRLGLRSAGRRCAEPRSVDESIGWGKRGNGGICPWFFRGICVVALHGRPGVRSTGGRGCSLGCAGIQNTYYVASSDVRRESETAVSSAFLPSFEAWGLVARQRGDTSCLSGRDSGSELHMAKGMNSGHGVVVLYTCDTSLDRAVRCVCVYVLLRLLALKYTPINCQIKCYAFSGSLHRTLFVPFMHTCTEFDPLFHLLDPTRS